MNDLIESIGPLSGERSVSITSDSKRSYGFGQPRVSSLQHPLQSQWPPAYLGLIPTANALHPTIPILESVATRSNPILTLSDELVEDPADNPLLEIWSAGLGQIGENRYLVLPPGRDGRPSAWHDSHNGEYPSDKIYIRDTYDQAFSILLSAARRMDKKMCHLALGGTSGLGKSFFYRYIAWRLLHPDGIEVVNGPNTILLRDDPKEPSGYLYHEGSFFAVTSISAFLATNLAANWFNHKNAWIICDGAPPEKYMHCPTLVLSSPGNFQINNANGAKKYFKGAVCKVYLPPWSPEEIWTVASDVHILADEHEGRLLERFQMYGGIPRAVLQNFFQDLKPLESAFVLTDVLTALNEVGSDEVNHQKVLGTILHMIPDENLTKVSYQWGSTLIMETAFSMMFKLTKTKTECFLHGAMSLHLGTFYGLLFEPYFHRRITDQGFKGKIRKLLPAPSDSESLVETTTSKTVRKRQWYGAKKLISEVVDHVIPMQSLHHFHVHNDIQSNVYNVPDRKNFAAVDSVAPSIGEMYQIASGDNHPVKALHLRPLRKHFQPYLNNGGKVKLIFVVPPNCFEKFPHQKYIFSEKKGKGVKGNGENERESEDENVEADVDGANADLIAEVNEWVDQYVMEVNVDPLTRTFDRRIELQNKRTFKEAWGKLSLTSNK